jgi:hypothetical protein
MITIKKDDKYYAYELQAFQDAGIINASEREFYDNARISYSGGAGDWFKLYSIQEKLSTSLTDVVGEPLGSVQGYDAPMVVSDYIAAPGKGIMAPHDGKVYDSKSAYYKSLKQSGHMVVEPGMDKKREQRGDFNVTKELKEAAQKHGLIG